MSADLAALRADYLYRYGDTHPVCALVDRVQAAEAALAAGERVIRYAAYLMASRMEGTPIVDSYGAAYRVLFGHLYPDQPLPNASALEAW